MKKRKKGLRFKTRAIRQPLQSRIIEIEPEDLAAYVSRAEKEVLPIIEERQLSPAAAQFFLAQHTHRLVTGDPRFTIESGANMANTILALWEAGYYTPGPDYPYTLQETLREVQEEPRAQADHAESFRPFTSANAVVPRSLRHIYGGIVLHPETNLWQIWLMPEGRCTFVAAYRDPAKAQSSLEIIINMSRRGGSVIENAVLYKRIREQADGELRQLPFDMMLYLIEHLDRYPIEL